MSMKPDAGMPLKAILLVCPVILFEGIDTQNNSFYFISLIY